jgi:histidine triad (HIT) family protein
MVAGEIEPHVVYENDHVLAFRDINPRAPVHVLIIPKKHIPTLSDLTDADTQLAGEILQAAKQVAQLEGIAETGYRTVFNNGSHAGQEVYHIHLHLLGGRDMTWPPG